MPVTRVPLVDLGWQHREVADDIATGFARVLERTAFIGGSEVAAFEAAFADFCGVEHCVGVANGTDALELALRALDVGPGAEVIIPANSYIATAEAVARAGATPVLADADPTHLLVDVERMAGAVTPRTRALIPVDLYGQLAPMEALVPIAGAAKVALLEDAAQSHGARRFGRAAGSAASAAAVSFYPGKNLGAYGDAGALLTNDATLAARVRRLGNHGGAARYEHAEVGFNSRLDSLQAVVLSAKLARLEAWNGLRRAAASVYDELLRDTPGVCLPATLRGNEHAWHLYVIRIPRRDAVLRQLHAAGVDAGIHYPAPIHLTPAFAHLGYQRGAFPVAERAAEEILSLPLYPGITVAQQERVVAELGTALAT